MKTRSSFSLLHVTPNHNDFLPSNTTDEIQKNILKYYENPVKLRNINNKKKAPNTIFPHFWDHKEFSEEQTQTEDVIHW